MFKAAMLELVQTRLSALAGALLPSGGDVAHALVVDTDDAGHDGHLANLGDQFDLTFGLRDEVERVADAAGEAIGVGPVSGMTLDAGSARMSALQVQKQLAMEAVSIVNAAPQALINLLS